MSASHVEQALAMPAQARAEAAGIAQPSLGMASAPAQDLPARQCLSCGAYTRPDGSLPCDH
ncbi:hypothetical protein OVY01_20890 [Robbsia sp. Bb-Pol-6]|uniref:Uncharacterized protein n=1 Tax=Robbsia betulipollinis TaxID=2981849 RepID=A0ABT3ZT11_9BURK|nr:hypothetical protein [Robbsia betulipollinis]MCY0389607.1 hypothetical protein [Robbsia betulipollinis]